MKTDTVGQIIFDDSDLIDLVMQGRDLESISRVLVDNTVDVEAAAVWLERVPEFTCWSEPPSQEVFDVVQQSD